VVFIRGSTLLSESLAGKRESIPVDLQPLFMFLFVRGKVPHCLGIPLMHNKKKISLMFGCTII